MSREEAKSSYHTNTEQAPTIDDWLMDVRLAWPEFEAEIPDFAATLLERLTLEKSRQPRREHIGELYLAWLCSCGHERALARFEAVYMPCVDSALAQARVSAELAPEVKQAVRSRLLVAKAESRPKIVSYSGAGSFAQWLRVVAMRAAYDLVAQQPSADKVGALFHNLADGEAAVEDVELAYFGRHYGDRVKQALEDAIATLPRRDRVILRFHLVDRVSIDGIGKALSIHRATAARQIQRARNLLAERTKKVLADDLGLSRLELDSIYRLVNSQLELSLSRIL